MIHMAANVQDAQRQVVGEAVAGFSRREDRYIVPKHSHAARDVEAITLKSAARKQAHDREGKMHVLTSTMECAEEFACLPTSICPAPPITVPFGMVTTHLLSSECATA